MEVSEQLRRRSSSFNPKAAPFNPAATEFQPPQPSTSATVDENAGSVLSSPVSVATVADSPSQHAEDLRRTFPNVVFPHIQSAPLQQLIPNSNMAVHSWANELESHAMNLGLPIAPSQSNEKKRNAQEEGRNGDHLIDYSVSSSTAGRPIRTDTPAQEGEKTVILFPLEARAQGLDGELVQQALTKTLTAEDLAKHLEGNFFTQAGHDISSYTATPGSDGSDETVTAVQLRAAYDQGILRPPPGLVMPQHPHMNTDFHNVHDSVQPEQQLFTPPVGPRAMTGAPGLIYATPQTVPTHLSHNTRAPSYEQSYITPRLALRGRRVSSRGRFAPRPKRMDQGPMPSNADIYPEDAVTANWSYDGSMYNENHLVHSGGKKPQFPPKVPANLRVGDVTAWPTPAEARTDPPTAGTAPLGAVAPPVQLPPPSNIRRQEGRPEEEYQAQSSTATEAQVSTPSPTKLVRDAGTNNLRPDERPLTPGQMDGSRYGLRLFGIGFSDNWDPPAISPATPCRSAANAESPGGWDVVPFRIRPRLHNGWGGWEWAHRAGWYNDE